MAQKAPTKYVTKLERLDLHQLEAELEKVTKLETPEADDLRASIRHALRVRREDIKRRASEFELNNYTHLLFFDSTDGFCKIIGNSLVMYRKKFGPRMNRKISVQYDDDSYHRSKDGVVISKLTPVFIGQLRKLGAVLDKERSTSELHFYRLPNAVSLAEMKKLRDEIYHDTHSVSGKLVRGEVMPEATQAIDELLRLVYHSCKRVQHPFANQNIAVPMMTAARNMKIAQIEYANQNTPTLSLKMLEQAIAACREMRGCLAIADVLGTIPQETIAKIAHEYAVAFRVIKAEYDKIRRGVERKQQAQKAQKDGSQKL